MEVKPGTLMPTTTWSALKTFSARLPVLCSKTSAELYLSHRWYNNFSGTASKPDAFSTSQLCFIKSSISLLNITFPPHFQHVSSSIRRNNLLCYQQPNSNVDVYAYSFYPRTIRIWNRLPEAVVCAPSVCAFKPIALNAIISAMSPPASLRTL